MSCCQGTPFKVIEPLSVADERDQITHAMVGAELDYLVNLRKRCVVEEPKPKAPKPLTFADLEAGEMFLTGGAMVYMKIDVMGRPYAVPVRKLSYVGSVFQVGVAYTHHRANEPSRCDWDGNPIEEPKKIRKSSST